MLPLRVIAAVEVRLTSPVEAMPLLLTYRAWLLLKLRLLMLLAWMLEM